MDNTKRLELTITALKNSLANKVATYEGELANIKAEATILLEDQGSRISELEQENAELKKTLDEFGVKDSKNEDVAALA